MIPDSFYEKLGAYLHAEGFSINQSGTELRKELRNINIVNSLAKVAFHLGGMKTYGAINYFDSERDGEAFNNVWKPMRELTSRIYHKFHLGNIYTTIVISADNLNPWEIKEIVSRTEYCALNARPFAAHMTQLFITRQAGWIKAEIFFIFTNVQQARQFRNQLLDKCTRIHRFKHTFVTACMIDMGAREVACKSKNLLRSRKEKKRRQALF